MHAWPPSQLPYWCWHVASATVRPGGGNAAQHCFPRCFFWSIVQRLKHRHHVVVACLTLRAGGGW